MFTLGPDQSSANQRYPGHVALSNALQDFGKQSASRMVDCAASAALMIAQTPRNLPPLHAR